MLCGRRCPWGACPPYHDSPVAARRVLVVISGGGGGVCVVREPSLIVACYCVLVLRLESDIRWIAAGGCVTVTALSWCGEVSLSQG